MAFVAPSSGYHDAAAETQTYLDASAPKQQHHHYAVPTASSLQNPPNPPFYPQVMTDIKPRLTKEQHDILETEFQRQNKPSTQVKKGFAENLNVSLDKVNVSALASSSLGSMRSSEPMLLLAHCNHLRAETVHRIGFRTVARNRSKMQRNNRARTISSRSRIHPRSISARTPTRLPSSSRLTTMR